MTSTSKASEGDRVKIHRDGSILDGVVGKVKRRKGGDTVVVRPDEIPEEVTMRIGGYFVNDDEIQLLETT